MSTSNLSRLNSGPRKMSENKFVERFCHKYFHKNPKKNKNEILKQITHLYSNGRKLEEIVSQSLLLFVLDMVSFQSCLYIRFENGFKLFQGELTCDQLKVLYLHNNFIQKITNLDQMRHLTHLYLQWNRIQKIENLTALKNLKKLYLSYNQIQRLEGVENLNQLEELHLEYQNLPSPQHEFSFDEGSLIGISVCM